MDDPTDEDVPTSVWAEQGKYLGHGLTWVMSILLFFFVGFWLDGKLGTSPWLTLGGAFFGGAAGFYNLYAHVILEPTQKKKKGDPPEENAL